MIAVGKHYFINQFNQFFYKYLEISFNIMFSGEKESGIYGEFKISYLKYRDKFKDECLGPVKDRLCFLE